jgi:release factor glutamine methyltransferase
VPEVFFPPSPDHRRDEKSVKVASLVAKVREMLAGAGVPSPEVDADILVGLALGLTRSRVHLSAREEVTGDQEKRALDLAGQRSRRIPLQHLTGEVEFFSRPFKIRPGVFIPRPETETLALQVLEIIERERPLRILDVCTGSGVLGVTIASRLEKATVVATDISFEAVDLARENAILNGVASRMDFIAGDGLDFLDAGADGVGLFDAIVFNPPYVESGTIEGLEPEVRDHDPRIALDGGPDGLRFIEGILPRAASLLKEGGALAFEIGAGQGKRAGELVENSGLEFKGLLQDLAGRNRIILGRKPGG